MINNITFTGRETMLIDAAQYAAETAARRAAEKAKNAEPEVIKASTRLLELPQPKNYTYLADDIPVPAGTVLNYKA